MRLFVAGDLTAAVGIAMPLAWRLKEMVYENTSAVGGRVFVGLGQWKRCIFHAAMNIVQVFARYET